MLLIPMLARLRRVSSSRGGGVLLATLCGAIPATAQAAMLRDGFAESTTVRGWPGVTGVWGGDLAQVGGDALGVSPRRGDSMLQFRASGGSLTSTSLSSSDLYRLIDLTGLVDAIAEGDVRVRASYYVNRVLGDAETDSRFGIGVHAYDGDLSDFRRAVNDPLAMQRQSLISDGDIGTWERVTVDLMLPVETRYIAVWIGAQENVFNDTGGAGPEFDGHFADDVAVQVRQVPAPGVCAVLAGAWLVRRRRR